MKQQLLLLEDVDGLGRSGDLVTAKPGFTRNFLLPQKKALLADKHTVKMQARLQEERAKKAAVDRKDAEGLAERLKEVVIKTEAKIDPDGKMYGSVTSLEIARMLQEKEFPIERRHVQLPHPIKNLGIHTVELRLNEGVPAFFRLEIEPEGGILPQKSVKQAAEAPQEPTEPEA